MTRKDYKKLTKQEYKDGVRSGELLHVFNKETKKIEVVRRDGYYPPETLNKLVNIENLTKGK